jgi:uncharacterized protein YdaU (DUF1376 family)
MTKKRWFRFYIDAWLNGTFGMSPNEIAAYITVLCELYDHEGFVIRPDYDLMARRCGMRPTSFRKALDGLMARGKLTLEGDMLTSKAVSEEIKSREKLGEKSAESREKLAEKRNEIKATRQKLTSNIEERIQNNTTFKVVDTFQKEALGSAKSPAVANFIKRREMFRRRTG